MHPTRAAPIGPLNGIPDIDKAAEAPIIAGISGSISVFMDITVGNYLDFISKILWKHGTNRSVD